MPASPDQTDGWIETSSHDLLVSASFKALIRRPSSQLSPRDLAARTRANAILMHMSILCGFPIFLFALFKRDDALVLHHAKAAGAGFVLFYGALLGGLLWEPILFWCALALYVPSLLGVWRAAAGERLGLLGLGLLGEVLFFPFQPRVKESIHKRLPTLHQTLPRDHETTGQGRQDR